MASTSWVELLVELRKKGFTIEAKLCKTKPMDDTNFRTHGKSDHIMGIKMVYTSASTYDLQKLLILICLVFSLFIF